MFTGTARSWPIHKMSIKTSLCDSSSHLNGKEWNNYLIQVGARYLHNGILGTTDADVLPLLSLRHDSV
ncbi:hypothetical protein KIN20_000859 [Parelaphostrongylus tenuis]|uniref:Uncharacterized protein n=1 Tax=Parelaphostrongylus tenuis TaxID=148309 RepID=A0AAD5QFW5_PARTN|nr:hypothetical protein KIN20_000859 [Parelaphostrongylus tenuis]